MMKTQGRLTKQRFDVDNSEFAVEFTLDTSISAPSIAYLSSDYYYEDGLNYKFQTVEDLVELPESAVTAQYTDNILSFTVSDDSYHGMSIQLSVTKK